MPLFPRIVVIVNVILINQTALPMVSHMWCSPHKNSPYALGCFQSDKNDGQGLDDESVYFFLSNDSYRIQ